MKYLHENKILITGPTGTGTTFLLGLFHELGYNTGYEDSYVHKILNGRGKGLEYTRTKSTRDPWLKARNEDTDISPHVIKQPIQDYGDDGGTGVICNAVNTAEENNWRISHIFVTVRNLTAIVDSVKRRMNTGEPVMFKIKGDEAKRQRELLAAEGVYRLLCDLAIRNYAFTLIEFPKSVDDVKYCFDKLTPVLLPSKHTYTIFEETHTRIANKNMVHVR